MNNISTAVLTEIRDRIYDQLVTYQQELDLAYKLSGEDPLDVKLGVKITPDNGKKKVTTSISFIKALCHDGSTSWVNDEQATLFDQDGAV